MITLLLSDKSKSNQEIIAVEHNKLITDNKGIAELLNSFFFFLMLLKNLKHHYLVILILKHLSSYFQSDI